MTDDIRSTIEQLQQAAAVIAEGLGDMTTRRWPQGPEGALLAAVMARQAQDAATLATACEVLVRRAAELEP